MSSKLHYLKATIVATVVLTAAGAGVAGATGALHSADDETKPTTEVTLPTSATDDDHGKADESHGQSADDHGKAAEDHGKSSDTEAAHDNHGAEVSAFARSTELEGREKGQAIAALASAGRSNGDHGQSADDHGKADESHGQSDDDHGKADDDHGKDAEHRSDD